MSAKYRGVPVQCLKPYIDLVRGLNPQVRRSVVLNGAFNRYNLERQLNLRNEVELSFFTLARPDTRGK